MLSIECDDHLGKSNRFLIKECVRIMRSIDTSLKTKELKKLFTQIESHYFPNNFHNFKHAFEVFQMTHYLITCSSGLSTINKKILLMVAICHDIHHLGFNNKKLRSKSITDISDSYYNSVFEKSDSYDSLNDVSSSTSFNEKVHIMNTHCILLDYTKALFNDDIINPVYISKIITSVILSTDLSLHSKYVDIVNTNENELAIMIHIMKIADLSHILRPFKIHIYWVFNLLNEEDGKLKHESLSDIAKDTCQFANHFLKPLLDAFTEKYPRSMCLSQMLLKNIDIWNRYYIT